MIKRTLIILFSMLFLNIIQQSSQAYRYDEIWNGSDISWSTNNPTLWANNISFPSGSPFRAALQQVFARFNLNPSNFRFNLGLDEVGVGYPNTVNEIWFSSDHSGILSNTPAITKYWYDGGFSGALVETDIILWADEGWTASVNKNDLSIYGGGSRPFQNTMLHEMGHAAGLKHVSNLYNIMGQDYTFIHCNGNAAAAYFGEDGTNGLIYLYGASQRLEDVSLTHWKYAGYANGEYSVHNRTQILDDNRNPLVNTPYNNRSEPSYTVFVGQTFYPYFTIENNGYTSPATVDVGYYLSSDDNITTEDRWLMSRVNQVFNRDVPDSHTAQMGLPNDILSGDYYIGAIVDPDNRLNEYDENNNASYIAIHVINPNPPPPTPTPRPKLPISLLKPTPNPWFDLRVGISPSIYSKIDLSNQEYFGDPTNKELVLKWDVAGQTDFSEFFVYLQVDYAKELEYLGKTSDGKSTYFEWKAGDVGVDVLFQDGPQSGHVYAFYLYGVKNGELFGPFTASGAIQYFVEGETVPTPTSTFINYPVPTPTSTFINYPVPTPTPTIIDYPTPIPEEYPTQAPFEMPSVQFDGDLFSIASGEFTQELNWLPDAASFTLSNMQPMFPIYRLGYVSPGMGNTALISLENNSLLTIAYEGQTYTPLLAVITPKNKIVEFARMQYPKLRVNDQPWRINSMSIAGMVFNGKNRLDVLLTANASDETATQFMEISLRAAIIGPFNSSVIDNFAVHEVHR